MKKLISLILALVMIFLFAACGDNDESTTADATQAETTIAKEASLEDITNFYDLIDYGWNYETKALGLTAIEDDDHSRATYLVSKYSTIEEIKDFYKQYRTDNWINTTEGFDEHFEQYFYTEDGKVYYEILPHGENGGCRYNEAELVEGTYLNKYIVKIPYYYQGYGDSTARLIYYAVLTIVYEDDTFKIDNVSYEDA